jgi:hypothetical protein
VDLPVLEIVGLDLKSGLKMGLSGLCFAANKPVRPSWRQRSFPTANALVNLLIEEPIKGLPTLLTCHLSRLMSRLERGLLHRSVAHYWSNLLSHCVASKSYSRPFVHGRNVRRRACWKRGFLTARDLSRPRGGPGNSRLSFSGAVFSTGFNDRFYTCFQNWIQSLISWACSATDFESVFESRFQYAVQRLARWTLGLIRERVG